MITIKNFEEKKLVVLFCKCTHNKHPKNNFVNSTIYNEWLNHWKNDFEVDGKCLKMWHQKLIESVSKYKSNTQAQYYNEYNQIINSITDYANQIYDIKIDLRKNRQKCIRLLKEYRKNCLEELSSLIDNEISIKQINPHDMMHLTKYVVKKEKVILFKGYYEEVKDFIETKCKSNQ